MKIGILGSGIVGQQLGLGFLRSGHEVKIGTRDPQKLNDWGVKTEERGTVGTFSETALWGDVIVLAINWAGLENAISLIDKESVKNKIVIDVTNPLDFSNGAPPKLLSAPDNSGGEKVQKLLPEARVVKAFNTISANIMTNPKLEKGTPDLFIAGNDSDAKYFVSAVAMEWGWNSIIDLGGIGQSYLLEANAMLWITYGFIFNNWTHAFKLLKK